jgi:glycosyltransferase involved in cell wall biosynthesis
MNLSLIIPVYNEEENLPLLYDSIQRALRPVEGSWEVIFVDDGSKDNSLDVLGSLVARSLSCSTPICRTIPPIFPCC